MESMIDRLTENIKIQAKIFMEELGCFHPFGSSIDIDSKIVPLSVYTGVENPPPFELINLLEKHILSELQTGRLLLAAIAIDTTVNENGQSFDAIEIRYFENGKQEFKKHLRYVISGNEVRVF
jgi:hypothetical protein